MTDKQSQIYKSISKNDKSKEKVLTRIESFKYDNAWKNPNMHLIQRKVVDYELDQINNHNKSFHVYDCAIKMLKLCIDDVKKSVGNNPISILDVGCSTGYYYDVIKKAFPDEKFVYIGCDYSKTAIEFARKKHPDIRFDIENAIDLPYPKKGVDIVFASSIASFVPNTRGLLKNLTKISRHYVILHRLNIAPKPFICTKFLYDETVINIWFKFELLNEQMKNKKFNNVFATYIYPENKYCIGSIYRRDYMAD